MTDDINAADAAPNSLREDLEEAWDRLSAEADDTDEEPGETDDEAEAPEPEEDPDGPTDDGEPGDAPLPLAHWPAEWRERFQALPEEAKPYALDLHKQFETAHSERSAIARHAREGAGRARNRRRGARPLARDHARAGDFGRRGGIEASRSACADRAGPRGGAGDDRRVIRARGLSRARPRRPPPRPATRRRGRTTCSIRSSATPPNSTSCACSRRWRPSSTPARGRPTPTAGRAFPHFDTVRPKLAALIRAGAAAGFEDAYEQAVWADPNVRQKALEAHDAELAARRESARKAEVAKARNAGRAALSGSEPVRSALPPARSHREELERVWDRMVSA